MRTLALASGVRRSRVTLRRRIRSMLARGLDACRRCACSNASIMLCAATIRLGGLLCAHISGMSRLARSLRATCNKYDKMRQLSNAMNSIGFGWRARGWRVRNVYSRGITMF